MIEVIVKIVRLSQLRTFQPNIGFCGGLGDKEDKKKEECGGSPRIKWGSLNMANAIDIGEKLKTRRLGRVKGIQMICGI